MRTEGKRKWLIIAHCMNMDGQAASHHVSDKLPYLRNVGIEPILLSAASGSKDLNFEHHQVFSPAPSGLKFEMRHYLRKRISNKHIAESLIAFFTIIILPFFLVEKIFIRYDSQWSWFLTAYLCGRKVLSTGGFETIYVHGGASSAFLTASMLSKKFQLPWIAECYDPLIHKSWNRSWSAYRWNERIEKIICQNARLAIWYTDGALKQAITRNPKLGSRGVVIRPGMTEPSTVGINYSRGSKIRFCYFGGLTNERSLTTFLRPLVKILKNNPELQKKIEVHTYGGNLDKKTTDLLENSKALNTLVKTHGRLEHDPRTGKSGRQRVNEEMRKADFLILLHGEGQICNLYIPSKAYEYLWAKRPIIVITPCPIEWIKFMDEKIHSIINQEIPEQIGNCILNSVQDWENGKFVDLETQKTYSAEDAISQILKYVDLPINSESFDQKIL